MDKLIDRRSNHLSVHQSVRSAIRDSQQLTSPIGVLFLKLPPPPCAVLLVYMLDIDMITVYFMITMTITSTITI